MESPGADGYVTEIYLILPDSASDRKSEISTSAQSPHQPEELKDMLNCDIFIQFVGKRQVPCTAIH